MHWKVCASNVTIDIFLSMKIREIEPEAAYGVSEWQGGQRLDESSYFQYTNLFSMILICFSWHYPQKTTIFNEFPLKKSLLGH